MKKPHSACPGVTRRSFLADTGMGFTGLVLGSMLFRDGVVKAELTDGGACHLPPGQPHFTPKAKRVVWLNLPPAFVYRCQR